jgi:hypothetical protein
MARPWRIQFDDAIYHLPTRGNVEGGRIMGVSGSAVSMGIKNFRQLLRKDERLRTTAKSLARRDNL